MDAVVLLQIGSAALLNGAFAWLAGALASRWWLGGEANGWQRLCQDSLRRSGRRAALACLLGALLSLWAATAVMGGVSLGEAADMLPAMLVGTAYGKTGLFGLAMLAALALLAASGRRAAVALGVLMVLFALSRASVSHAGEHGLLSLDVAVEAIHLLLIALWLGGVAVAGWIVLPAAGGQGAALRPYMESLSSAATVALAGIVASGAYNAWQRLGGLGQLVEHPYGIALTVKLALFALAACLGGYNKLLAFPAAGRGNDPKGGAMAVLRIESLVLLGALLAAAVLSSQEPP